VLFSAGPGLVVYLLMGMLLGDVDSPVHISTTMWPWDEGARCVPLGEGS